MDFIVTSEEAGREKPKPSIFRLALKKAGCSPKETVMVGDSVEKDVRGAEKAGIAGILFAREGKRGGRIHKRF